MVVWIMRASVCMLCGGTWAIRSVEESLFSFLFRRVVDENSNMISSDIESFDLLHVYYQSSLWCIPYCIQSVMRDTSRVVHQTD